MPRFVLMATYCNREVESQEGVEHERDAGGDEHHAPTAARSPERSSAARRCGRSRPPRRRPRERGRRPRRRAVKPHAQEPGVRPLVDESARRRGLSGLWPHSGRALVEDPRARGLFGLGPSSGIFPRSSSTAPCTRLGAIVGLVLSECLAGSAKLEMPSFVQSPRRRAASLGERWAAYLVPDGTLALPSESVKERSRLLGSHLSGPVARPPRR